MLLVPQSKSTFLSRVSLGLKATKSALSDPMAADEHGSGILDCCSTFGPGLGPISCAGLAGVSKRSTRAKS